MQLTIENIGLIRQAQIQINGLTVIAGANDSGKSTVGKVIFSLVKAIQRYQDDLEQGKIDRLEASMRKLYVSLRKKVDFSKYAEARHLFFPTTFLRDFRQTGLRAIDKRQDLLNRHGELDFVTPMLQELKLALEAEEDIEQAIREALTKVLYSEFMGEFTRKDMGSGELSRLGLKEGENDLFQATLTATTIQTQLFDQLIYQDATFIETPYVLNLPAVIRAARARFSSIIPSKAQLGRPNIALHIQDLNDKLREGALLMDEIDFNVDLSNEFDTVIADKVFSALGGSFSYDEDSDNFIFKKGNYSYQALNLASGVKSFGLLQLLEKGGFLRQGNLIIIDEPEVHLHPKWQLLYAEIIICLVERGAHVIVTTHSPYMLEALELRANALDKEAVHYYYAKNDNGTTIQDVTNNIDVIYESLAQPFEDLEELSLSKEGGFTW